jgi:hypothetical protein
MKKISLLLVVAFASVTSRADDTKITVPGFVYEDLYSGNGMTALDFDYAGRMYVCEKQGRVLVFNPDSKGGFAKPTVLSDFREKVNSDGERGLLGLALDPGFASNHWLYVFYSAATDQQLVRLTVEPSTMASIVPGSALVLLSGLPNTATNHKAGDIHFHPKEPQSIYLTLGDDAHKELAPNLEYFNGKLLRLDKATGKGLPDNPFYDGNLNSIRSRVWALGLRNPFRFAFYPGSASADSIYISENGDRTDRIARIKRGANGGWGPDGDKGLINPPDTNVHILQTTKPCLTAIAIAADGPFGGEGGMLYYEQWFGPDLYRGRLTGQQRDTFEPVPADQGRPFATKLQIVNLKFGPDGALYTTQTYYADSVGDHFKLGRIRAVPK